MKVLLIGEFSSLHKNLKEGLIKSRNIDVTLISGGDGWKQIGGVDLSLPQSGQYKNKVHFYKALFKVIKEQKGYDVVQLMNVNQFPVLLNTELVKILKRNNRKLAVLSAGDDYALLKSYKRGLFEYYIYDAAEPLRYGKSVRGFMEVLSALNVQRQVDMIIPTAYEYEVGYREEEKATPIIPYPINLDSLVYKDNIVKERVVFFHGLNREKEKGTPYIREAMQRLKERYPNDVETIIDGRMPYDKYLEVMARANVLLDQCMAYGYGINGCIGMAQGKVVMSGGFREENIRALGVDNAPGVYIKPDVDFIFMKLCEVLEKKSEFLEWGQKSRQFVEQVHDYEKVANKYLEVWGA